MNGIVVGSLVGIAAYLILIAFIGYWAWRKNLKGDLDDQYLVSRNLNVFVLVGTLFATWFSTFAFLGGPGTFYLNGVNWLVFPLFNSLGPVLIWVFGSRMWTLGRRYGFVTPSDLLATYYDDSKRVRVAAAVVGVAVLFPYAAVQLSGISKAVASATDNVVTYETSVLLVAVSVGLYSILGGSRAVVWTDTIQGFIFAALLITTAVLTVFWAGGWSSGWAATQNAAPEKLEFSGDTASAFFTLGLLWTFGWVLVPHLWQRMYMARSPQIMAKSMVLASGLSLWVVTFSGAIIGFLAMGIFAEIPGGFDSDALTPLLFREFLPIGAVALVVATFAAGMSTLDSQVLSGSSIFTLDIYRVGKPTASESLLSRVGKFFEGAFVIALVGFTLIPAGQALLVPLASVGVGFALCFLLPLIGALYWPRASEQAAFWSMTLGFAVMVTLQLVPAALEALPFSFGPPAWGFLACLIIFYAGSVLGRPVSGEKIAMFHGVLDTVAAKDQTAA
jgi:SSS family solute:Na+ symporter